MFWMSSHGVILVGSLLAVVNVNADDLTAGTLTNTFPLNTTGCFASTENGDFFGQTILYDSYSPHKNWESHATRLEADWMESEWFGTFIPYTDNWIFHIEMGWLYINEFNPESMWIWSEEKGWVWTTQSLLPFLYSNNTSNWLYILPRELEGKKFYNYETKTLE